MAGNILLFVEVVAKLVTSHERVFASITVFMLLRLGPMQLRAVDVPVFFLSFSAVAMSTPIDPIVVVAVMV